MPTDFEADLAAIDRIQAVPALLEVVCRTTGMDFAAVARVTEDRWIACAVRDDIQFGLQPGGELKVETTWWRMPSPMARARSRSWSVPQPWMGPLSSPSRTTASRSRRRPWSVCSSPSFAWRLARASRGWGWGSTSPARLPKPMGAHWM